MASEAKAPTQPENPEPPPLPLGYFQCKKRIETLQRFQNLLRYHEYVTTDPQLPPLASLLPPGTKPEYEKQAIDRELNKLFVPVSLFVRQAGVPTSFTNRRQKSQARFQLEYKEPEIETQHFDVIRDYFYVENLKISRNETFKAAVRVTDQAIGSYEFRKAIATKEFLNPAIWIAHLLRLPIWILYRAGFAPSQKFYETFIKTMMSLIFILTLIHYGILGWKDLTKLLPK